MKSEIPSEVWGMILREATFPESQAPTTWPGRLNAALFDPDSLEDQSRYPWRNDFKHPVDTPLSISTKRTLVCVSKLFHDLSRQYIYENLYFYDYNIATLSTLQILLAQWLPGGITTIGSWVKRLYILVGEGTSITDDWVDGVVTIIRQLTSLQGFFMILDARVSDTVFFNAQIHKIAKAIPSCISHFEWSSPNSWMNPQVAFPTEEIAPLFRCAKGLRAIRISAWHVTLPLGDDITLPELKYLEILAYRHDIDWPKLSSLTHVAFGGLFLKPTQLPGPIGGTLPMLSFLYVAQSGLPNSPGSVRDMLVATPNLRTLIWARSFPVPREHRIWELARSPSLQRFEIHFSDRLTPAFVPVQHDMEVDFAALREHILPFANPDHFPALSCLKLCGFRHIRKRFGLKEPRLDEIAIGSLTDLKSRGVQVSVEE